MKSDEIINQNINNIDEYFSRNFKIKNKDNKKKVGWSDSNDNNSMFPSIN